MIFIETPVFSSDVASLLDEDGYRLLQQFLADVPEAGKVIPGTGGLRKLRWALTGRGKRAGARVVYYWQVRESQILLLAIYAKSQRIDLSARERELLKRIVERWP